MAQMKERKNYVPSQAVEDAKTQAEAHRQQKPGEYQSQWKDQADAILYQIQNRNPFSYDASRDPMYRQAVDQYVRLGRQAMMDSAGQAAALTGGYGNSYSQTAAQQTYQDYLQGLTEKLPQFHQMALDQYQARGKDLMDRYNALSQREKEAFGQYQKFVEWFYARQDRLDDAYERTKDRDYHRYQDQRDYEYNQEKDQKEAEHRREQAAREQERWEREQAYQKERDKVKDQQWREQFEENRRRYEQQWAASHSGGGGRGGRSTGSSSLPRYTANHGFNQKQYEKDRQHAQQVNHYAPRPSGKPWTPNMNPGHRPFRPGILG